MNWKIIFGIILVVVIVAIISVATYKYNKCDYGNKSMRYVAKSVRTCSVMKYACNPNEIYFQNECGCGCVITEYQK